MIGCPVFVALSSVAMLFYPGGTFADPTASGYSFFTNFFSELGLTKTRTGQPNTVSAILWVTALTMGGLSLALFFFAFAQFFTRSKSAKTLSAIGSIFGVISGTCLVGVAFAPANLYLQLHIAVMTCAFVALPIAVVCYAVAILREPGYPNRYGVVFLAFATLLVLYVVLLTLSPASNTLQGLTIQATGQKVIVYAIIISIFIQARGAREIAQARSA